MEDNLYNYKAKVINVVDGDTIDVEIDLGLKLRSTQRLRLLNVDTPERGQVNFNEATQFTRERVNEQEVVVHTYKSDVFGRYLANVFYKEDGIYKCLNEELSKSGLLKVDSKWNVGGV